MRRKSFLAVVLSLGMILQSVPSVVYAGEEVKEDSIVQIDQTGINPADEKIISEENLEIMNETSICKSGYDVGEETVDGTDLWSGTGTEEDPFLINSVDDLVKIRTTNSWDIKEGSWYYAGFFFKLNADLDLSSVCGKEISVNWIPVEFGGVLDGNRHKITGLYFSSTLNNIHSFNNVYAGLFSQTKGTTVVKNLDISGEIDLNDISDIYCNVGALTGENNGRIESCCSNVYIHGSESNSVTAGGITGTNYGVINGCENDGQITGKTVGGITGINTGGGTVSSCINKGKILAHGTAGGIVGSNHFSATGAGRDITDSQNSGDIQVIRKSEGIGSVGGIVGVLDEGSVQNCKNTGAIKVEADDGHVGGIAGSTSDESEFNLTTIAVKKCENHGRIDVSFEGLSGGDIGGLIGDCLCDVFESSNSGCINVHYSGKQEITDDFDDYYYVTNLGGMAGRLEHKATISDCYNVGSLKGICSNVGGMAGYIGKESAIQNAYSACDLVSYSSKGEERKCGSIASDAEGTIINSFDLKGISQLEVVEGNPILINVSQLTADGFKNQNSFSGWNFDTIWKMGVNRPVLRDSSDDGKSMPVVNEKQDNEETGGKDDPIIPVSVSYDLITRTKGSALIVGDKGMLSLVGIDNASVTTKSKAGTYDSATGIVTAVKKGNIKLVVPYTTKKGKIKKKTICTIKVESPKLKSKTKMKAGKTKKLKVAGTKKTVEWTSLNAEIATVEANGKVHAISPGIAIIKAKIGVHEYSCTVIVK